MDKPKTMEELMHGINSFLNQYEFDRDRPDSILVIGFNSKNSMAKLAGHADNISAAIVNMMLEEPAIKDMVYAAYHAYERYNRTNSSPALNVEATELAMVMASSNKKKICS